jgi:hypothetical protein
MKGGGMYVWGLLQNQPGIGGTEINAEEKKTKTF